MPFLTNHSLLLESWGLHPCLPLHLRNHELCTVCWVSCLYLHSYFRAIWNCGADRLTLSPLCKQSLHACSLKRGFPVTQAGLKLLILPLPPPRCWASRPVPPRPVKSMLLIHPSKTKSSPHSPHPQIPRVDEVGGAAAPDSLRAADPRAGVCDAGQLARR